MQAGVISAEALMPGRVAVAFSGGRDSTALLHAVVCAARDLGGLEVLALHVHHGLSALADGWLTHAEQVCADWAREGLPVVLQSRRVQLALTDGQSVEAEARRARYAALAEMARLGGADMVLLAHHRRDQAETLLLQALRGASVSGLAAMPREIERHGVLWVRPWLDHPREAIEAYLAQYALPYIDDDSNADVRFARNRMRHEVWPALTAAFPQAEVALAASARRLADQLPAALAWRECLLQPLLLADPPGGLDARQWAELAGSARRESLAHWYRGQAGRHLSAAWIERLAHELPGMVHRQQAVRWGSVGLSLYRGVLRCEAQAHGDAGSAARRLGDGAVQPLAAVHAGAVGGTLSVTAPGALPLPAWQGTLQVVELGAGGVAPHWLRQLSLRQRTGGEQFQAGPGRPPRALKKQYQSAGVPAWCRQGPLFFAGDQLVFGPGLGVDARCLALPGEAQWGLVWVPWPA